MGRKSQEVKSDLGRNHRHEIVSSLGDWLQLNSKGQVFEYGEIALQFKKFRDQSDHPKAGKPVLAEELSKILVEVRAHIESHYRTTLYNVRGVGYKLATSEELALYTAKFFKRTILYADRTYRLVEIVDRKYIPAALRTVFCDTEGRVKNLSLRGKKFLKTFSLYLKEEQEKKLLEDKSNGKT